MQATLDAAEFLHEHAQGLGGLLGIEIVSASKERVVGEMPVGPRVFTVGGRVHGGAIMAFADTLAAYGAVLNLPAGCTTTTLESKTNFFAPGRPSALRGEATPLHVGRTTSVWQTLIANAGGEQVALVVQTQMVLQRQREAHDGARGVAVAASSAKPVAEGHGDGGVETADARRKRIFQAACKVISQKGFAKATVREIATAAGMPVPTMYLYVRSKEDILALIYDTYLEEIKASVSRAAREGGSAMEKLRAAIAANMQSFDRHHRYIKLMYQETKSLSPEAQRRVLDHERTYIRLWRDIIAEGVRSGEFDVADAELTANLIPLVCAVWPLRFWSVGRFGLQGVQDGILQLVLDGIRKRAGSAA